MSQRRLITVAGSSGDRYGVGNSTCAQPIIRCCASLHRRAPASTDGVALGSRSRRIRPGLLEDVDAVVNLCRVSIGEKRWCPAPSKQSLQDSRIADRSSRRGRRRCQDSGVGQRQRGPDSMATPEARYRGQSLLPVQVSLPRPLSRLGARRCPPTTPGARRSGSDGLVLAPSGGVLSRLRQCSPHRVSVARLRSGRQYIPWISLGIRCVR